MIYHNLSISILLIINLIFPHLWIFVIIELVMCASFGRILRIRIKRNDNASMNQGSIKTH